MIKYARKKTSHIIKIDLRGQQGNAFYILGVAAKLSKTMGLDSEKVRKEMTSGDYENLIKVFDNYFGHLVILYR